MIAQPVCMNGLVHRWIEIHEFEDVDDDFGLGALRGVEHDAPPVC